MKANKYLISCRRVLTIVLGLFLLCKADANQLTEGAKMEQQKALSNKKILMIVAPERFQDDEFSKPFELLSANGATITIASTRKGTLSGMSGKKITANGTINEYKAGDFDVVLFIGGSGSDIFFDNDVALRIAREAAVTERVAVLGAICIAPVTLANAGVLMGKKATSFPSVQGQLAAKGAHVESGKSVVCDGKIITAVGPQAASDFAKTVLSALTQ
jgi:protease I